MAQVNARLKQQHNEKMAYWQFMGYNPGHRHRASLGKDPAEVPCIFLIFAFMYLLALKN
jgi:hypothetical protein